jgi:hypothetical protein
MASQVEICGICGRRFEEDDIVLWAHGELFHRICADRPDESKQDPGVLTLRYKRRLK